MESWLWLLLLNSGAILIGCAFAYMVCVLIPITDRIEIRQTSHFPPHTTPLPPPSKNFIQRLQRREKVIKPQLTIAFVIICVAQLALFVTVPNFPQFSFPLSLLLGLLIQSYLRMRTDMKALTNPISYSQTSITSTRISRGIQLKFTDYVPIWAIMGYFGVSLISQLLWVFIQLPGLAHHALWISMLVGANILSTLGIFVISGYARTPIIAYTIEDIHWEDDIRAESTNTLVLSTALLPWVIPLVAENFSVSAMPLALIIIYLLAMFVLVGIFYWASRQYARQMWTEVGS